MDSKSLGPRPPWYRSRIATALLIALLAGMMLGPPTASAASAAWMRVKNWPSVMKVLVTNWPSVFNVAVSNWPSSSNVAVTNSQSNPIPVDHRTRTPVSSSAEFNINSGDIFGYSTLYTVPSDKWLVLQTVGVWGTGQGPMVTAEAVGNGQAVVIPFSLTVDNLANPAETDLNGSWSGEAEFAPGTEVDAWSYRVHHYTTSWDLRYEMVGYLVNQP